jgi:hypothetical protein
MSSFSKSFISCLQSTTVAAKRVASLIRFREKRKERCFDKKIRYGVRKEVAQKYRLIPCPFSSRCCHRVISFLDTKTVIHYEASRIWLLTTRLDHRNEDVLLSAFTMPQSSLTKKLEFNLINQFLSVMSSLPFWDNLLVLNSYPITNVQA